MRIIVFNVKFSANLGDGLLAECLEQTLTRSGPDVEVETLDLAGRKTYGSGGLRNRRLALGVLELMPGPVRQLAVELVLTRLIAKLRPEWRSALSGADAVVVGGGNLFTDTDLNFPLKIAGAIGECASLGLPVVVYGVGVSDRWSGKAEKLISGALLGVKLARVSVRDTRSQANWRRSLATYNLVPAQVCHDPALLAADVFKPDPALRPSSGRRVAIGVTAPLALRYHGGATSVSENRFPAWLNEVVSGLAENGWNVVMFTNGSGEDVDYLQTLRRDLKTGAHDITISDPFSTPGEFARFIASHDLVIAHRLHACIAAYAYGVAHVGLRWDPKLDSFFQSVERGEFVTSAAACSPGELVSLAERAYTEGISSHSHAEHIAKTREEIANLSEVLRNAATEAAS